MRRQSRNERRRRLERSREGRRIGSQPASERLSLLAADALTTGRPEAAYMFADRRCRLQAPTAYDFLLRATASRLMNEAAFAEADLTRAFEIDPTHDLVIDNVLRWGGAALRPIAAASFLDGNSEDPESLRLAMLVAGICRDADRHENARPRGNVRGLGRLAAKWRPATDHPTRGEGQGLRARGRTTHIRLAIEVGQRLRSRSKSKVRDWKG